MEQNEQRFEAYFKGQLSDDEVLKFNDQLASDQDFNASYQYFLSLKEATSSNMRDDLRAQLEDVDVNSFSANETSTHQASNGTASNSNRSFIKWILVLIALAALTYFSYSYFNSSNPNVLYASNFELYEAQNVRGGNSNELKEYYTQGDYETFIIKTTDVELSPELLMMLANAHMQVEDYDSAHKVLLEISEESSLRDLKYWNLGLVSLKLNHIPQAQNHFNYLLSVSNYKKAKVKKILSKISK